MTITGGPAEVACEGTQASITVHGQAGTRTLTLPGAWRLADSQAPAKLVKGTWQITYQGGEPLRILLNKQ
jgi:hypothetical protein